MIRLYLHSTTLLMDMEESEVQNRMDVSTLRTVADIAHA